MNAPTTHTFPLYKALASLLQRRATLQNHPLQDDHTLAMLDHVEGQIGLLCAEHLPRGCGFDNGTELLIDKVGQNATNPIPRRLVFSTAYHHLEEGYYAGWTHHIVRVKPSFLFDFSLSVSGENRNDIKDYIADTFTFALAKEVTYQPCPESAP